MSESNRGYYYCDTCQQIRWECYVKDGKCTFCGNDIRFIKDETAPQITQATKIELMQELIKQKDVELIPVYECAEIHSDSIMEYDEHGNSYIADHYTHKIDGPATILVVRVKKDV